MELTQNSSVRFREIGPRRKQFPCRITKCYQPKNLAVATRLFFFFMGNYQEAKNEIAMTTAKDSVRDRAPLVMVSFSGTSLFSV